MPANPKVTLAKLVELMQIQQDSITQFINQTRIDVSTIAGAVKELALEMMAERREREEHLERIISSLGNPQANGQSMAGLETKLDGSVGFDSRM